MSQRMGKENILNYFIIILIIFFLSLQSEQEAVPVQSWSLICDLLLSRGLEPGLVFQLRQGEVLLLCEVIPLPHFSISEQILNFNHDKFILKPQPESPV